MTDERKPFSERRKRWALVSDTQMVGCNGKLRWTYDRKKADEYAALLPGFRVVDADEYVSNFKSERRKELATLTPEENAAWERYFELGVLDGMVDAQADEFAWLALCNDFPRLRGFGGCKP